MRAIEKRLRLRIKELEQEIETLEQDRRKFQSHFGRRFRWWIKLMGENGSPSLPWLLEDEAKFLNTVKWFSW